MRAAPRPRHGRCGRDRRRDVRGGDLHGRPVVRARGTGRVGDVPQVGSGFFCTEAGGASATGAGEDIARVTLSRRAVDFLDDGFGAQDAADRAIDEFEDITGSGGGRHRPRRRRRRQRVQHRRDADEYRVSVAAGAVIGSETSDIYKGADSHRSMKGSQSRFASSWPIKHQ